MNRVGDGKVWERAASQRGLITRRQARDMKLSQGFIARRVARGAWVRVLPGVFRIAGTPEDPAQERKAADLYAGPTAALSGAAAAAVHGFPRLGAGSLELTTHRNLRAARLLRSRRRRLLSFETCRVDGVRVTTESRTLLDLCEHASEQDLRAVVDHLLRRKRTSAEALAKLAARRRDRGVRKLRRILEGYRAGEAATESECEAVVLDVLESCGLPRPTRQHPVRTGQRLRRLDFSWPDRRVLLEVDGFFWHSSPAAFENDRARRNALTAQGWRIFQATWDSIHDDPEALPHQLAPWLGQRDR